MRAVVEVKIGPIGARFNSVVTISDSNPPQTYTLAAEGHDGRVELHVRDSGNGFPAELLGRAFDRFARADVARARGGSGLGLSIVKAIAESHEGTAHVANTAAGGADTWISLPAARSRVPSAGRR